MTVYASHQGTQYCVEEIATAYGAGRSTPKQVVEPDAWLVRGFGRRRSHAVQSKSGIKWKRRPPNVR